MAKRKKKEYSELEIILSKEEITRTDCRFLLTNVFRDSYFYMSEKTGINPTYLREMITAVRPLSQVSQEKILSAAFVLSIKRPKIMVAQ